MISQVTICTFAGISIAFFTPNSSRALVEH
jgi:hypothetical protein